MKTESTHTQTGAAGAAHGIKRMNNYVIHNTIEDMQSIDAPS